MNNLGYWAKTLCNFIHKVPFTYIDLLKNEQNRSNSYNEFIVKPTEEQYDFIFKEFNRNNPDKYNTLIVRGLPDIEIGKNVPSLNAESYLLTNHLSRLQTPLNSGVEYILKSLKDNRFDKSVPLLVCGDSFEDYYADYLRNNGYNCITKNRENLIKNYNLNANDLARVDFILAIKSNKMIGPVGSSLKFAAKEYRSYIGLGPEIKKNDWDSIACLLPVLTNNFIESVNSNKHLFEPLYRL